MDIRKPSSDAHEALIEKYSGMPLNQLQLIQPCWACGAHIDLIQDKTLHPNNNEFVICLANIRALVNIAAFEEVNITTLFTGAEVNDGRLARILDNWNKGVHIDPPTLYLSEKRNEKVYFSDGRHMTKLTYLLGQQQIPIAIFYEDLTAMKDMMDLKPV